MRIPQLLLESSQTGTLTPLTPVMKRRRAEAEPPTAENVEPGEAPATAATRLQQCFVEGDLVEAEFVDGYWVPAKVMGTKVRQLLVQFERALLEEPSSGPKYECRENDMPRDVARRLALPVPTLLKMNEAKYAELTSTSRLRRGTLLRMPVIYLTRDNETPKSVAARLGRDIDEMLELSADANPNLHPSAKLRSGTMLVLPQRAGRADAAAAAVEAEMLPPQLLEKVEVLAAPVGNEGGGDGPVWQLAELRRFLPPQRKFQARRQVPPIAGHRSVESTASGMPLARLWLVSDSPRLIRPAVVSGKSVRPRGLHGRVPAA